MRPGTFAGVGLFAKTVLFGKASTGLPPERRELAVRPNANAFAGVWVRTIRQECLDWMLVWG